MKINPLHGDLLIREADIIIPKRFCNTSLNLQAVMEVTYRGYSFYVTKLVDQDRYSCIEKTTKGSPFGKETVWRLLKKPAMSDFIQGAVYYPTDPMQAVATLIAVLDSPLYDKMPEALKSYGAFIWRTRHNIDPLIYTGIL